MRVAHITDIHWMVPPSLRDLNIKRVFGTANLYLMGRKDHFSEAAQSALMAHVMALSPDLLIITGDLTAQALPQEFAKARNALQPVLDRVPTFVIPGNHDVYTKGAAREDRIRSVFGHWMGQPSASMTRLDCGEVTCLGLNPNRPMVFRSSGLVPEQQLEDLARELRRPELEGRCVILCIHYPLLDRHGAVYDGSRHGLLNASALIEVLQQAPQRPDMILHGHIHHGFHVGLELEAATVPIYNCGSSGYAFMPDKRRAGAMNVYDIAGGELTGVERYLYDGERFTKEPSGPYGTGR
jgi:3',5'-cyclic AMP phosphodiesterase CpdA